MMAKDNKFGATVVAVAASLFVLTLLLLVCVWKKKKTQHTLRKNSELELLDKEAANGKLQSLVRASTSSPEQAEVPPSEDTPVVPEQLTTAKPVVIYDKPKTKVKESSGTTTESGSGNSTSDGGYSRVKKVAPKVEAAYLVVNINESTEKYDVVNGDIVRRVNKQELYEVVDSSSNAAESSLAPESMVETKENSGNSGYYASVKEEKKKSEGNAKHAPHENSAGSSLYASCAPFESHTTNVVSPNEQREGTMPLEKSLTAPPTPQIEDLSEKEKTRSLKREKRGSQKKSKKGGLTSPHVSRLSRGPFKRSKKRKASIDSQDKGELRKASSHESLNSENHFQFHDHHDSIPPRQHHEPLAPRPSNGSRAVPSTTGGHPLGHHGVMSSVLHNSVPPPPSVESLKKVAHLTNKGERLKSISDGGHSSLESSPRTSPRLDPPKSSPTNITGGDFSVSEEDTYWRVEESLRTPTTLTSLHSMTSVSELPTDDVDEKYTKVGKSAKSNSLTSISEIKADEYSEIKLKSDVTTDDEKCTKVGKSDGNVTTCDEELTEDEEKYTRVKNTNVDDEKYTRVKDELSEDEMYSRVKDGITDEDEKYTTVKEAIKSDLDVEVNYTCIKSQDSVISPDDSFSRTKANVSEGEEDFSQLYAVVNKPTRSLSLQLPPHRFERISSEPPEIPAKHFDETSLESPFNNNSQNNLTAGSRLFKNSTPFDFTSINANLSHSQLHPSLRSRSVGAAHTINTSQTRTRSLGGNPTTLTTSQNDDEDPDYADVDDLIVSAAADAKSTTT